LGRGENAGDEAVAVALERTLDPADVDEVVSYPDDHGHRARSGALLAGGIGASLVHQRPNVGDGAFQPDEDRLADQEMADIELDDGRDRSDRSDRRKTQSVSRMAFEPDPLRMRRGTYDPRELRFARSAFRRIAVGP